MKLITTLLAVLGAVAIGQAADCSGARQCQCLFQDGSHCCVYGYVSPPDIFKTGSPGNIQTNISIMQNAETGDTSDCTAVCSGASRLLQSGEDTPAKCNAGGKFSCVGIITAQGRTPCYNDNQSELPCKFVD
jgi:hypothetical protein